MTQTENLRCKVITGRSEKKRLVDRMVEELYRSVVHDDMKKLLQQIDDMANVRIEKFVGTKNKLPKAIYLKLDKKF